MRALYEASGIRQVNDKSGLPPSSFELNVNTPKAFANFSPELERLRQLWDLTQKIKH